MEVAEVSVPLEIPVDILWKQHLGEGYGVEVVKKD